MSFYSSFLANISDIVPYSKNAREHSREQVTQIVNSIREFGFTSPVLVDEANVLIAGHGRLAAAREMGMTELPAIVIEGLSATQKQALRIADNKLALNASWDDDLLRAELMDLRDVGFDLGLTGFGELELAGLFADMNDGLTDPDDVPEPPAEPVTQPGDVWLLGRHRLVCGDCTDASVVEAALAGVRPDIAVCDPPYGINVVKGGSIGGAKPFGKGRVHGHARNAIIQPGIYPPVIGDDTTDTAVAAYHILDELQVPVIVMWGGNYYANALPPSRCWLVWDKENTGSFADAELAWTNQDAIVRLLRHQWSGLIKASERGERRVHPTQKPVALAEWCMTTLAPDAKTVVDLFLGSGSTLIAAEMTGRACHAIEISPAYCDVAIQRWQNFTGQTATRPDGTTLSTRQDTAAVPA